MKIIYKYPIGPVPAQEPFEIEMPKGAEIMTVQRQGSGEDAETCIWALVDYTKSASGITEQRNFVLCGTGHEVPSAEGLDLTKADYVGTFQLARGDLVWHLFAL